MPFYVLTFNAQYAAEMLPTRGAVREAFRILRDAGVRTSEMVPSRDRWRYSSVELSETQAENLIGFDKGLSGRLRFYMEGPFGERNTADAFWQKGHRD